MNIGNPARMEREEKTERSVWRKGMRVLLCLLVMGASAFGSIGDKVNAQSVTVSDWPELVSAFQNNANGDVIELGDNIANQNQESVLLEVAQGKSVTLDLNGHDLTIENVPDGEAGIRVPDGASFIVRGSRGGTLIAKGSGGVNGTVLLGGAGIGGRSEEGAGQITIETGTITATGGAHGAGIGGGYEGAGGSVTIDGGMVTATGGTYGAGIGGGLRAAGGSLTIDGGTVTATGGYDGAGIGGGSNGAGGSVTINEGTVTATGSYYGGAGIGGGWDGAGGSLTIDGGTVTATGGTYGAGIGGGYKGAGGSVTINGGKVTPAAGQTNISVIGAGQDASTPSLTLKNNGTITIPSGQQLIIPQGTIVTNSGIINGEGRINGQGRIHNSGTIESTLLVNTEVKEKTYELSFDLNGAGGSPPFPITLYGLTIKESGEYLPSLTRSGYAFGGWYLDSTSQQKVEEETIVNTDAKLYAKWTINTYRVTFDSDGGTPIPAQNVDYGQKVSEPATVPTRTGYTFDGWYSDTLFDRPFTFSTPIEQETTVYAKWVDRRSPQVTLNTIAGSLTNRPFEVTATFDEPVTGFNESKIDVTGGTVGAVRTVSERVYVFEVTPSVQQGRVTVTLQAGAAQDLAGNDSQVSDPLSLTKKAEPPIVQPENPPIFVTPNMPSSSTPGPVSSATGTLTLAAGQAGDVSLGQEIRLKVPAGATNAQMDIHMKALTASANGLTADTKPISTVYQLTKTIPGNFLRPVSLTLSFDPTKLANGEQAAVFYQNAAGSPWVRIESGTIEQGRNAVGTATPGSAVITVPTDHFTKFAVLAVNEATAVPNLNDSDATGTVPAVTFTDIAGHWAGSAISKAAALGWVKGYADGTFRPSGAVTRAEFTTMLVRTLSFTGGNNMENQSSASALVPFADQAAIRDWAGASVAKAQGLGWVNGDASGNFRPNDSITRAEMAVALSRALERTTNGHDDVSESEEPMFKDQAAIPAWARKAVEELAQDGLMKGRNKGTFAPSGTATRAEAVQMLMNARSFIQ